jgi:thiamine-monophosphate kinase
MKKAALEVRGRLTVERGCASRLRASGGGAGKRRGERVAVHCGHATSLVAAVNERDAVRLIRAAAGGPARGVEVGIGDDAAVLAGGLVVSADMLVEDVHFRRSALDARAIGHRAAAANLSDLAAMGARPLCLLASFGLPGEAGEAGELAAGVAAHGVPLVGGDLTRARELIVSIAAIGAARRPVLRSGGRAGDLLAVTGALGGQAASGYTAPPTPRLAEGVALAAVAHAMIDVSDGLATDVERLAEASGTGARVELGRLPCAPGAGWREAAAGGEDFELLVALPRDALGRAPVPLTVVGELTAEPGVVLLDPGGEPVELHGFDHFAPPA